MFFHFKKMLSRKGGTQYGSFFSRLELDQKLKNLESFYGYNIQVSVHLPLKFPGQHIFQRGDIPSSTAPVIGLGHDIGRFAPFVLGPTQILHNCLGSKR